MPLIPLQPTDVAEVTAGGDVYRLRKHLSFTEFNQSASLIGAILMHAAQVNRDDASALRQSLEDVSALTVDLLSLWLVGWSHPELLDRDTIKRIPRPHLEPIQTAIMRLHNANRGASDEGKSAPLSVTGSTEKPAG